MRFFLIFFITFGLTTEMQAAPSHVHSDAVSNFIAGLDLSDKYIQQSFKQCFPNTLDTTITLEGDNTTYIITGDINAMWVRDSCAQVHPYIFLSRNDNNLKRVINGTILRHIKHMNIGDPFINSWEEGYTVHEYKYEPDGPAYFIRMCWLYWKVSGDTSWTNGTGSFDCHNAFNRILDKLRLEQTNHTPYTGMVYSLFRPSDDNCVYPYLVPSNMFLASTLPKLKEMYQAFWPSDTGNINRCQLIRDTIMSGLTNFALYDHPVYGKIWAFEVDGNGQFLLIDDANVPSLLSAPYIEFCSNNDTVYRNTRRFLLSSSDPYYYSGSFGSGVGSYHTAQVDSRRAWPMSVMMQAFTSGDDQETALMLDYLNNMDAGTHFMHEGVYVDNPAQYSRSWFAWANTLLGELVMRKILGLNFYPGDGVYLRPVPNNRLQSMVLTNSVSFGDVNNIKIRITGTGPGILSGTINAGPVIPDAQKGIRISSDPADINIKMKTNLVIQKSVNLTGFFNRDGMSWDSAKNNGSISGSGNTSYDALFIPDILYSSYSGLRFSMGNKSDGQNNVISSGGQTITLTNVKAAKLHILASGVNGSQTGVFRIRYRDNSYEDIQKSFTDWCSDEPAYEEHSAVVMGHRHDSGSDQVVKCHVYEYVLYLNKNKALASITLPANAGMVILAMNICDFIPDQLSVSTNKVPKFVIGLDLESGPSGQVLVWDPIERNSDNSILDSTSRILFYRIYQSTDLKNWVIVAEKTNTSCPLNTFGPGYFKVTALNAGYQEGDAWAFLSTSTNLILTYRDSTDDALMVKLILSPGIYRSFCRENNAHQDDLYLKVSVQDPDEDSLFTYKISARTYSADTELAETALPVPMDAIFYFRVDPVTGYIEDTTVSSPDAGRYIKVFRHNGIEWVYFSGAADPDSNSVAVKPDRTGRYSIRMKKVSPDEFTLMQIEPKKIFTPAGTEPHNRIRFYFENPQIKKAGCRIFTVKGGYIKDLDMTMNSLTDGYFSWNGKDKDGRECASGVYVYQLECGNKIISGTIILAR
ncbi:MAG: glycoside hydrolase family 125 protein [bacterium]|nr:glycoside hydrolase family 125 protein [bacterium]